MSMTPLPALLGGTELVAWRLDKTEYAATWDSGEGGFRYGGRWNRPGVRAVYCSIDPSTAMLEVAVHMTFEGLDRIPHVLTSLTIADPAMVHVVHRNAVPDPVWLTPGRERQDQQAFGDGLLAEHKFVVIPSTVSTNSWNLVFVSAAATGAYVLRSQEGFVLDPRLHPTPTTPSS